MNFLSVFLDTAARIVPLPKGSTGYPMAWRFQRENRGTDTAFLQYRPLHPAPTQKKPCSCTLEYIPGPSGSIGFDRMVHPVSIAIVACHIVPAHYREARSKHMYTAHSWAVSGIGNPLPPFSAIHLGSPRESELGNAWINPRDSETCIWVRPWVRRIRRKGKNGAHRDLSEPFRKRIRSYGHDTQPRSNDAEPPAPSQISS
jgi:hypothetical protein